MADRGITAPADGDRGGEPAASRRWVMSRFFLASVDNVPTARAWTCHQLNRAGIDSERIERAELLLSEAVTNAIRHTCTARATVRITVSESGSEIHRWLRIAVHDTDPRLPRVHHPASWETGGRGMELIDALADSWGVQHVSSSTSQLATQARMGRLPAMAGTWSPDATPALGGTKAPAASAMDLPGGRWQGKWVWFRVEDRSATA